MTGLWCVLSIKEMRRKERTWTWYNFKTKSTKSKAKFLKTNIFFEFLAAYH